MKQMTANIFWPGNTPKHSSAHQSKLLFIRRFARFAPGFVSTWHRNTEKNAPVCKTQEGIRTHFVTWSVNSADFNILWLILHDDMKFQTELFRNEVKCVANLVFMIKTLMDIMASSTSHSTYSWYRVESRNLKGKGSCMTAAVKVKCGASCRGWPLWNLIMTLNG